MRKITTIFFIVLLAINFFYVLSGVLFKPIISMDTIGMWLLKAKAIYLEKGFPFLYLTNPELSYSSQDYPLLLPLIFALIYKIWGGIHEKTALIIYPFIYLSIILLSYQTFRLKTTRNISLLFTYLYSMLSPLLAQAGRTHAGNADIVLVFLSWLMAFLLFSLPKSPRLPVYLMLLAMIASQIKMEGIFLVLFLIFLPLKKNLQVKLISLSLTPFFIWSFVTKPLIKTPFTRFYLPSFFEIFIRSKIIFFGLTKEMLNYKNWYIFWPIFLVSFFIEGKMSQTAKKIISPYLLLTSLLFFLVYFFSSTPIEKYVPCSIDRVLFQLSPWFFLNFFEKALLEVIWLEKKFSRFL